MATTTNATSPAAATTAATRTTAQSAVQNATKTLLSSLDTGSGVDTGSLVTSLVEAQFATRSAKLAAKAEKLTAQVSGVASVKSAINTFATALDTLAKSGTLTTAPTSSTAGVLTASTIAGQQAATVASTIRVDRLAAAQAVATQAITNPAAPGVATTQSTVLGSGTFTIQLGKATTATDGDGVTRMTGFTASARAADTVTFSLTDASVDTIAAAINANSGAMGISATVVTAADGTPYLSVKGATGSDSAFSIAVAGTTAADQAALDQFAVGKDSGRPLAQAAQNAKLTVDGIAVERASNTVDDLVAGVSLKLAATGTTTLTPTRPTEALTQAVGDVVDTYNTVMEIITEQTNILTGNLASDPAAQSLLRQLRALTLKSINPAGATGEPRTLAELGVKTARDGTLSVDKKALATVLTRYPAAVETMFADSATSKTALPGVLKAMAADMDSLAYGLGASTLRYTKQQIEVTDGQAKVARDSTSMTTRLTQQYSSMNSRVTAYKATQKFLTNQIDAWNKSD